MNVKKYIYCFFITAILCISFLCGLSFSKSKSAQNNFYISETFSSNRFSEESGVYVDEQNFPDRVFREWILNGYDINGAGSDGFLSYEEIQDIKNITIRGTADALIKDLKGIEYFTELTSLSISYNSLTSLDLTENTKLSYLNCSYNRLESLNITTLSSLVSLNCEFNYLKELDLSGSGELTVIYCRHNLLENIDFSNNTKLVFIETFDNLLKDIDVSMLSHLEFLHIDHNRLTTLDMSKNLNLKGGGFVVRNNYIERLVLPEISGFTVYYDDFAEQDPIKGYEKTEWYADEYFTVLIDSDVEAKGQTLYVKRLPNSYTVSFVADGATGAPSSIKTYYDERFLIPETVPSKRGYKFLYWSDDKYSDSNVYRAGESVINLAGDRFDGERTELYAKWQGIRYGVRFDKNADDAYGYMQNVDAVYGTASTLPLNLFKREGHDFEGWSLKKDGNVIFNDGQSFIDLTSNEGEVVTLYAIWSEDAASLQSPYLDLLKNKFEKLKQNSYYREDLNSLITVYDNACLSIKNSVKDTSLMKKICDEALNEMDKIPSEKARAEEIAEIWKNNNSFALKCVNTPPVPTGMAGEYLSAVNSAIENAETERLAELSTLTDMTAKLHAAKDAHIFISEDIGKLNDFIDIAKWLMTAENAISLPLNEVLPEHIEIYNSISQKYSEFSENETVYVEDTVMYEINRRYHLAYSKKTGTEKLNAIYEKLQQNNYGQNVYDKIISVIEKANSDILSAKSENEIEYTLENAEDNIKTIIEENQDQTPSPENPDTGDNEDIYTSEKIKFIIIFSVLSAVVTIIIVFIFVKLKKRNKQI